MYKGKRTFDLAFSVACFLATLPLFVLIAIAVRLSSPGPILFRQERLGHRRKRFIMLKFRSMYMNTGKKLDLVQRNDPRVTPVGRILRATHLDELPQLINVIFGEMSMVGPRPDEIGIAEYLMERIPGYRECYEVMMPGITGPSQLLGRDVINNKIGREGEQQLVWQYRTRCEKEGIMECLLHDISIIRKTIPCVLARNGV